MDKPRTPIMIAILVFSTFLVHQKTWAVTPEEQLQSIVMRVALPYSDCLGKVLLPAVIFWEDWGYIVITSFDFKPGRGNCEVAFRIARDFNVAIWRSKPKIRQTIIVLDYHSEDPRFDVRSAVSVFVARRQAMSDFRMWSQPEYEPSGREFIQWVAANKHEHIAERLFDVTYLVGSCIK